MLTALTMQRRQICWAHLLRKFMALSEDKKPEIAKLGEHLLLFGHVLFHQWHRVRDGTLSRAAFRRESMALRMCVESLLQQGVDLCLPGVTGSCADVTVHGVQAPMPYVIICDHMRMCSTPRAEA